MKALNVFLLIFTFTNAYGQLDYEDLDNLRILCKKKEPKNIMNYLVYKGYTIDKTYSDIDNGSYVMVLDLKAKLKLGTNKNIYLPGTDLGVDYDEISILIKQFQNRTDFEISQYHNSTDKYRKDIENSWALRAFCGKIWTCIYVSDEILWEKLYPNESRKLKSKREMLDLNDPSYYYHLLELRPPSSFSIGVGCQYGYTARNREIAKIPDSIMNVIGTYSLPQSNSYQLQFLNQNPDFGDIQNNEIYYSYYNPNNDRNSDFKYESYQFRISLKFSN